jgi:hypothetical protein
LLNLGHHFTITLLNLGHHFTGISGGIEGSRTAVWRFYERHGISFKKTLYAAEQKRAEVARARRPAGCEIAAREFP